MSLMDKMERKLGFLSHFNIMIILIGAYALGFLLSYIAPSVMSYLVFHPALILRGQVWRLVTFVVTAGNSGSVFLALITCFIYFSISKTLEQIIGTFRMNFFLIMGILILLIFGFVYYYVMPDVMTVYTVSYLTPTYLYHLLFVLFALMFPDARFLLMFIIPIKGKYMVILTLVLYAVDIIQAFSSGIAAYGWLIVFMVGAAVLNLILFLLMSNYSFKRPSATSRNFRNAYNQGPRRGPAGFGGFGGGQRMNNPGQDQSYQQQNFRHKCEICGRTNVSHPELEFRYCSRCYGAHEYCMEHLYTHIHIKDPNDIAANYSEDSGFKS